VKSLLVLPVLVAAAAAGAWATVRHQASSADALPKAAAAEAQREIQSVALDGGRGLPLATLRDCLSTLPGEQLDAGKLVQDRAELERELEAKGYLAARVEPAIVTFSPSGGAYITFPISAGPVFKLRSVTVKGASLKDQSVVTLAAGDDAVASRIERARATLADALGRRGKPATVTVSMTTDAASGAVDLELLAK
jgi:outer membrane protein assembly factor BamA